jgi:hypothetical protein
LETGKPVERNMIYRVNAEEQRSYSNLDSDDSQTNQEAVYDLIMQIATFEGLPVLLATNYE